MALAERPCGPQLSTARESLPNISQATAGSRFAVMVEHTDDCPTHHAVLASALAISSITCRYVGRSSSWPPSERGNSMR
jgi:hypothetical protein